MTLLVPLLLVLYMLFLPLLFSQTGIEKLELVILDQGTGLAEGLSDQLSTIETPEVRVVDIQRVSVDSIEAIRSALSDQVRSEEIDGYISLQPNPEVEARASYYARETGNIVVISRISDAVRTVVLERILQGSGVSTEKVRRIQRVDLETVTVSKQGEEKGGFETAFFSTLAFAMLLYMAVLINGQGMAMAIVEEKSSRLIEVILGAVTALEFMAGKILGVMLSGLTQLAIWVACALVAGLYALPALAIGVSATGFDLSSILNFQLILYFSIFFMLGYLFYSTVFAAIAATCSSTEELSQALFPAMFPFILAFFATFYAVPNPSATITRILSLLPPFTPLVMLARVNVLMPPLWEVWLSILLLIHGVAAVGWAAGKIFRFALLMYGKRPSFPELLRMIRSA